MKLNKPSYGVFMVDIFASSVGIFILVSLLYIIESAKATSNEAMVEKFKTLIKRDLIPVDRYSLPVSNDPLHDWGVRARHAREKQEALILLLRDKVLLYHTNQMLDVHEIVDSDIILNYYQKYNKNRRLFLEIHYHDAYHTLKAKIDEALPENVHQWVHWAYNAGNINNPNPVSANASRPNLDMTPNGRNDDPIDPDSLAMPSSVGGGSSQRGTSAFGTPDGNNQGTGSEGSQNANDQGSEGANSETGEQQDGESGGTSNNQTPEPMQMPEQDAEQMMMESVDQQLNQVTTSKQFVEQFMQGSNGSGSGNSQGGNTGQNQSEQSNEGQSESVDTSSIANTNDQQQTVSDVMQMPQIQQQAQNYIRQNVFLVVPLHSPISRFDLDIKVPGFTEQQIKLGAVQLKLHHNTDLQSPSSLIKLVNGDAIVPLDNRIIAINPLDKNKGWFKVKVIKVQGETTAGWLFGYIEQHSALLPLFENTVQSYQNDDYWFERNNDNLDVFENEAYIP